MCELRLGRPEPCNCAPRTTLLSLQIRNAFADLNVEPASSVLHGRKGLTPTVYVAPFLTPYANALGQARGSAATTPRSLCFLPARVSCLVSQIPVNLVLWRADVSTVIEGTLAVHPEPL